VLDWLLLVIDFSLLACVCQHQPVGRCLHRVPSVLCAMYAAVYGHNPCCVLSNVATDNNTVCWPLLAAATGCLVSTATVEPSDDPCLIVVHPCVMLQLRGDPVGP
jgi:hypothetical protein